MRVVGIRWSAVLVGATCLACWPTPPRGETKPAPSGFVAVAAPQATGAYAAGGDVEPPRGSIESLGPSYDDPDEPGSIPPPGPSEVEKPGPHELDGDPAEALPPAGEGVAL